MVEEKESELESLQSQVRELQKNNQEQKDQLKTLQNSNLNLVSQVRSLEFAKEELADQVTMLKEGKEVKEMKKQLDDKVKELDKVKEQLKEKDEEMKSEIGKIKEKLKEKEAEEQKLQSELRNKDFLTEAANILKSGDSEREEAEKQLQEELDSVKQKLEAAKKENELLKLNLQNHQDSAKELESMKLEITAARERQLDLEQKNSLVSAELEEKKKSLQQLQDKIEGKKHKIRSLKSAVLAAKADQATPSSESNNNSSNTEKQIFQQEIEHLTQKLDQKDKELSDLRSQLEASKKSILQLKNENDTLSQKLDATKKELENERSTTKSHFEERIDILTTQMSQLTSALEMKETDLQEINIKYVALEKQLEDTKFRSSADGRKRTAPQPVAPSVSTPALPSILQVKKEEEKPKHSFLKLWNRYDEVSKLVDNGLLSCKEMSEYFRKYVSTCESISALLMSLHESATARTMAQKWMSGKSVADLESGSVKNIWKTLTDELERLATGYSMFSSRLNQSVCVPVAKFLSEKDPIKKNIANTEYVNTKKLTELQTAMDKAKELAERALVEQEAAHQALQEFEEPAAEAAPMDPKKKDLMVKCQQTFQTAQEKSKQVGVKYQHSYNLYKLSLEAFYGQTRPSNLTELENIERERLEMINQIMEEYILVEKDLMNLHGDLCDKLSSTVCQISIQQEIDNFVKEHVSQDPPPEAYPPLE
eukprot:TRINITY_DN4055_c0_g1_i1.p1 TRINITY_DN4055_c0_g1~~TRINITY_DN4055_c0_g1_i1.p1  ORF type:complete len:710 (-),score=265.06 TRINITY_DN4055_c0_g1_i1:231-2360(-)